MLSRVSGDCFPWHALELQEVVSFSNLLEAFCIKSLVFSAESSEEAVQKVKRDSKVAIHPPGIVQGVMVNVVQAPGADEPPPKQRMTPHPEVLNVHLVMDVVEHRLGPGQGHDDKGHLIQNRNTQQRENSNEKPQQQHRRNQPFHANVAEGGAIFGRPRVLTRGPHGLRWPVVLQVMNHVAAAESRNHFAMKKAVYEVADKFRDEATEDDPKQEFQKQTQRTGERQESRKHFNSGIQRRFKPHSRSKSGARPQRLLQWEDLNFDDVIWNFKWKHR